MNVKQEAAKMSLRVSLPPLVLQFVIPVLISDGGVCCGSRGH